jgi:hypothetical protein
MRFFAVTVCIVLLLVPAFLVAGEGGVSKWTFQMEHVVNGKAKGILREPLWSTDGAYLGIKGTEGILIHDPASDTTRLAVSGYTWQFVWLPEHKLVYELLRNRTSELHLLDVQSGDDKKLMSIPREDLFMLQATNDGRVAFTNWGRTSEWKADIVDTSGTWTSIDQASISNLVWEQDGIPWIRKNGTTRLILVSGPGHLWGPIKPSPHGDFLAVQTQVDSAVRTVIVTNEGKWVKVLPIGFAVSQWSSDDQIVLGVETRDDGETITSSTLALFDLQAGDYIVIATPPDMIPVDPTWHEGTGKLAFTDYATGSIVVGTFQKAIK